jgi:hypothetical protein
MKTLLIVVLIVVLSLFALNNSCSKKDQSIITVSQPTPPAPIEYPIDLNFSINTSCYIFYDSTNDYPWFREKDFYFFAYSKSNLPNNTSGSYIDIQQIYGYYSQTYNDAEFIISTNEPFPNENGLHIQPRKKFNFFTLPYQSGVALFSDTCYVTAGSGKYIRIGQKNTPLIFSGFIDLTNGTGSVRIKGSVYL